jgi:hypothetical protein
MLAVIWNLLAALRSILRARSDLVIENLALESIPDRG